MKSSKIYFWLVLLSSLVSSVSAQEVLWNRTYGGGDIEEAFSLDVSSDGGYTVCGYTSSYGSMDAWLFKTDSNGTMLWNKTFGTAGQMEGCMYADNTSDAGYIMAAYQYNDYSPGILLIKTDGSGTHMWNRTIRPEEDYDAYPRKVQQTQDNGYIIIAEAETLYGQGIWLVKTDSNGSVLWNKTFGGDHSVDYAAGLEETADGGFIVSGGIAGDLFLVKTDSEGNAQWNKTFGGYSMDNANDVIITSDRGYLVMGYTWSYGPGDINIWLIKTASDGIVEWNMTYGIANENAVGNSVVQTQDGGYAITGRTGTVHQYELFTMKTDANGSMLWNSSITGYSTEGYSIKEISDGEYVILGTQDSDSRDLILLRMGASEQCDLTGDYIPCGEISLQEVVDLINLWAADNAELADVVSIINAWTG